MKKLVVKGGNKLEGFIAVSGAKNAALPIIVGCLLGKEDIVLENLPHVADIEGMISLLLTLGVKITYDGTAAREGARGRTMILNSRDLKSITAPYDIVSKMRASVLVLGPLLARFAKAKVSLPGGCAIGARPIDIHLSALKKMGAKIEIKNGYIEAIAKGGLKGAKIHFPKPSVGATENIMMAATMAKGKTVIHNAAREPEIVDLANFLNAMGAKIKGAGKSKIVIDGVLDLKGCKHRIISDRIEAITYVIATAMTDGKSIIHGLNKNLLGKLGKHFRKAGIKLKKLDENKMEVSRKSKNIKPTKINTAPFPGFPTDIQAQFMSLMAVADGKSRIKESIFENRYMHVPELKRMGARIKLKGNKAYIKGTDKLIGAEVMATDLRASVSLVLAALVAKGESKISRVYHLERGYDRLVEKLQKCGADIEISY